MLNKKILVLLVVCLYMVFMSVPVFAGIRPQIIFIPHDDRPISFEQTMDTVKKLDYDVLVPPQELLGNRTSLGKSDELWQWLFANAKKTDAVVVSSDSLLYGSLVASRKHNLTSETILKRVDNFEKLHAENPNLKIYVFGSIMRSPRTSDGGEEPSYYAKYGPDIFSLTSLQDKEESDRLTRAEKKQVAKLEKSVPKEAVSDWMERRSKNFAANTRLVELAKQNTFQYLALGRDDNAPFSQTHKESRLLSKQAGDMSVAQFQALAGIDEMGMVLLTRAVNDITWHVPLVAVRYADGVGADTVPTYSDEAIGKSIQSHLFAIGAIPVPTTERADLVLMVNTAKNGSTSEANYPTNTTKKHANTEAFVKDIKRYLKAGYPVAVADIAFANGADNALMAELEKQGLLNKLSAYSGWNTANNSAGFAIGQGILTDKMKVEDKNQLLSVRLMDDWAYQANIRQTLAGELNRIKGGNYSKLDLARPVIVKSANEKMNTFAKEHLQDFAFTKVDVDFPWNRMFEASVKIEK